MNKPLAYGLLSLLLSFSPHSVYANSMPQDLNIVENGIGISQKSNQLVEVKLISQQPLSGLAQSYTTLRINIDNKGKTPILMSLDKIQISTANSHYSVLSASDIEYERDQQLRSMKSVSNAGITTSALLYGAAAISKPNANYAVQQAMQQDIRAQDNAAKEKMKPVKEKYDTLLRMLDSTQQARFVVLPNSSATTYVYVKGRLPDQLKGINIKVSTQDAIVHQFQF